MCSFRNFCVFFFFNFVSMLDSVLLLKASSKSPIFSIRMRSDRRSSRKGKVAVMRVKLQRSELCQCLSNESRGLELSLSTLVSRPSFNSQAQADLTKNPIPLKAIIRKRIGKAYLDFFIRIVFEFSSYLNLRARGSAASWK